MLAESQIEADLEPARPPVGTERFHRNRFIDYQLQRLWGEGYAEKDELREAASRIRSFRDHVSVFNELGRRAESEGRLRNAAFYVRSAEFFTPPNTAARCATYTRFVDLFDRGFADEGIERSLVPYGGAYLPASRLEARAPKRGTVVLFGGFDSLIEEFFAIWSLLAHAGFEVIAFDGPGQGGARAQHGLAFDHDWEKPVAAVLDHYELEKVALIGLSMGGYWALRAASREPRVDRVVSWSPVYDWLAQLPGFLRPLVRWMARRRSFMRWSIRVRMRLAPILRHVVAQTLYIQDTHDVADLPSWFLSMNAEHLQAERVRQDVLQIVGQDDAFQPPVLARAQAKALVNARSVTTRVFTREEHASGHCQMGNLSLATKTVADWLSKPIEARPR